MVIFHQYISHMPGNTKEARENRAGGPGMKGRLKNAGTYILESVYRVGQPGDVHAVPRLPGGS